MGGLFLMREVPLYPADSGVRPLVSAMASAKPSTMNQNLYPKPLYARQGKASVYDLEQKPDRTELQVALKAKANVDQVNPKLQTRKSLSRCEAPTNSV